MIVPDYIESLIKLNAIKIYLKKYDGKVEEIVNNETLNVKVVNNGRQLVQNAIEQNTTNSWQIQKFERNNLEIKLQFSDPLSISNEEVRFRS